MEPKTIEQIKEEKTEMENAVREAVRSFIKNNPGMYPIINVSITTDKSIIIGKTRVVSVNINTTFIL